MSREYLHKLKGTGYLTSTVSVLMLAVVSWSSAQKSTLLTMCLLGDAATSIVGMFCRWLSYELETRLEKSHWQKPKGSLRKDS